MARFRYTAKNMQGKTRRGVQEAVNEKVLQQNLKEQGFYLISAKKAGGMGGKRKFSSRQLAEFNREMSSLLTAGVSLVRALDIISQEEGIPSFARDVYGEMLTDIKKGISFSEAMENRNCFPSLMKGMIRSGEGNGNLDQVTARLAIQYEKEAALKQQVRSAMMYPLILLVMCVGIVLIIVTFVLPQFEELFSQMERLPIATEIVMGFAHLLVERWYAVLVGILTVLAVSRVILGFPQVRRKMDYLKVHMPVVGKLNKVIYTARFARTLSSLYSGGMSVINSLKLAAETIDNRYVEEQFDQVSVKVRSGVPLSESLREVDGLLEKLSSTILVGEESGRLDTMLDSIAQSMEMDAQEATKRMVTLLEPVMICIMGLMVGFVVAAVMLPIYESYGEIENLR